MAFISVKYVAVISDKYVAVISDKYVAVISDKCEAAIFDKYVAVISNGRRLTNYLFTYSGHKLLILRPMSFHYFSLRNLCVFD